MKTLENLTQVEILQGRAYIGFKTYGEAAELSEKTGFDLTIVAKKDDWNAWVDVRDESFNAERDGISQDYETIELQEEHEFIEEYVYPQVKLIYSLTELAQFIKDKQDLWDEVKELKAGEQVLTYKGVYLEIVKEDMTTFVRDGIVMTLALIQYGTK